MDKSINTAYKKQSCQKPPLSVARIAGEILAGAAFWIVPLLVVYGAGMIFDGKGESADSGTQLLGLYILGMFIFIFPLYYVIGSTVGVYLVGTRGNQTGSFPATLGFGFLGGLVMTLLAIYIWLGGIMMTGIEKIFIWKLILLIGPIAATIGFNLTRRYKYPHST
ncbi:MAG: hypothetical protein ACYSR9_15065 [Planctomycetota bacterium]|jgi:hypothetical protein